jgi:hypothetical protein
MQDLSPQTLLVMSRFEALIRFLPPPPITNAKAPMILGSRYFIKAKMTKDLYRTFPFAREVNMPAKQRAPKKANANFKHFKKTG